MLLRVPWALPLQDNTFFDLSNEHCGANWMPSKLPSVSVLSHELIPKSFCAPYRTYGALHKTQIGAEFQPTINQTLPSLSLLTELCDMPY